MQEFLWIKPSVGIIERRQVTLILLTVSTLEAQQLFFIQNGKVFYTGSTVEGNQNYADNMKEPVARPQESVQRSGKNCGKNGFKTHLETISLGVIAFKQQRIRSCGQNIKPMIKKFKTDERLMVFFSAYGRKQVTVRDSSRQLQWQLRTDANQHCLNQISVLYHTQVRHG